MVISSRLSGHRFAGSVSLGMRGSAGCAVGTVAVLVTRPYWTGRASPGYAVIESWHSTLGFELRRVRTSRPGRRPGPGSPPGWRSATPPGGAGLRHGAPGGLRAGRGREAAWAQADR